MPLETGIVIEDLDASWPLSGDLVLQGDDHLRLIKSILQTQFPGAGGNGFASVITATEEEINYLSGVTSSIQDQIDALAADPNLYAPEGTVMLFYSASPPTGWTQVQNNNNSFLRIADAAGGSGGTDDPTDFSWTHKHTTQGHQLTVQEMPEHQHESSWGETAAYTAPFGRVGSNNKVGSNATDNDNYSWLTSKVGGNQSHSHGDTGDASFSFKPRYINVMTASKDAYP